MEFIIGKRVELTRERVERRGKLNRSRSGERRSTTWSSGRGYVCA
ncbi:MAG: hypothetical protein NO515_06680 [Candidatus Methanomethylicia archaeon]|nr:hypothetical protein [Candidatus Methanomethylicia archaeon]